MPDDALRWLADRQAISDLVIEYCYRVAVRDVDAIVELFTSDCEMEVLGRQFEGRDGLRELYADALSGDPKPFVHNHLVEPAGPDRATGRCLAEIKSLDAARPGGFGVYHDDYIRVGGEWRFRRRRYTKY